MSQNTQLLQEIRDELRALRPGAGGAGSVDTGKLSAAFKSLQNAVVGTADSILGLSKTAAGGAPGLQNVMEGFSSIAEKLPALGGAVSLLTRAMGIAVGITEKNVDVYKQISSSGANFGGSLVQLRQAAMSTYMSIEDFGTLIKNNNQNFSKMGGTVDEGARAFVNVASTLQKSQIGHDLRALGYSSQELNQGLIDYISLTGGRTRKEMQNTDALAQGAAQYLEQLDGLAKLTGESREQLAAKMKEEAQNQAFQSYLLTLDEKGKQKAEAARAEALARGGKGAAEALQAKLMGLPPMTEAAQRFVGTMANGNSALDGLAAGVTDTSKSVDDIKKSGSAFTVGMAKDGEALKQVGSAIIMSGKDTGEFSKAIGAANDAQRNQVKTLNDQIEFEKRVTAEGKKQKESEAAGVIRFQTLLQETGNKLLTLLMPAFTFLSNTLITVTTYLIKFIEPLVGFAKDFIQNTIVPIFNQFKAPFLDFSNSVLKNTMGFIKKDLIPFFVGIYDTIKGFDFTPLINFFKSVRDGIMNIDWKGIYEGAKAQFTQIMIFIKSLYTAGKEIFTPTIERAEAVFIKIGNEIGPVITDVGDIVKLVIERLTDLWGWININVVPILIGIMKVMQPIVTNFFDTLGSLWDIFKYFIKAIKALLSGDFSTMGDMLSNAGKELWAAVKNFLSAIWESVKTAFNPTTWLKKKEEDTSTPAAAAAAAPTASPALAQKEISDESRRMANRAEAARTASPAASAPVSTPPVTPEEKRVTAQERLNNVNDQILTTLKAIEDHHRRTLEAVRKLNPNQF